jgi:methyltransferase-like protein
MVERLRQADDSYLVHEYLETNNEPTYFHDFMERAQSRGLQYLGEADFAAMLAANFAPEVEQTLRKMAPDLISLEQYMDFLRNRTFRQTLLVRQNLSIKRNNLDWRSVNGFRVASALMPPASGVDFTPGAVAEFRLASGPGVRTADPIGKAALALLAERWPEDVDIAALAGLARARLSGASSSSASVSAPDPNDVTRVSTEILRCYGAGIIDLRVESAPVTAVVAQRPLATAFVREQARNGNVVTNPRHESITVDMFMRQVLQRLDGARDCAALVPMIEAEARKGNLAFRNRDQSVVEPGAIRAMLEKTVPECLKRLAQLGLLAPQ